MVGSWRQTRRFYREVAVVEETDGSAVALDGRTVRTPAGQSLTLPGSLAEAVADEWRAQGDVVRPESMPLTQLANTAIDRVTILRAAILDELVGMATTDLLCYRVAEPLALVERQTAVWQPLLDWAAGRFDARLSVTTTLMPLAQPAAALASLRRAVGAYDAFRLTAVQSAAAVAGSLVVALALIEGRLQADAAFATAQLDELFQAERWGGDAEADARRARLRADLQAAEQFVRLLPA